MLILLKIFVMQFIFDTWSNKKKNKLINVLQMANEAE